MTKADLERLLLLQNNADTPELRMEYREIKEKIEKALEPTGTLKAYMKMWEDVVQERDILLKNQKTEQDKRNEGDVIELAKRLQEKKEYVKILEGNQKTEQDKQNEEIVNDVRRRYQQLKSESPEYDLPNYQAMREDSYYVEYSLLKEILGEKK